MTVSKSKKAIAIALSTALVSTSVLPIATAEAGHRKWQKRHHHEHVVRHDRNRSRGDAVAAGIIGFALGAIIANEASKNRRPVYQERVYVEPQPVYRKRVYVDPDPRDPPYFERRPVNRYDEPRVIRYEDDVISATYEPWTPEWANYCRSKYRSFNPSTGTYRGYDGLDHFCVVK